ncbi:alkaline phosphatase [Legionella beliardensis]|uniref:Alkaline phosphatase n=1 Tax=Legionella beliardensis TaxID=91822 RepID=A0A378I3P5_9GAMM|nr:alkaline phosphatase family protein [Legionella beliardensis]STX29613.1 alkaline phosphatase [Legionella beliardensis]
MKKLFFVLFIFINTVFAETSPPKLIVQIVIDQFRGDLIHQYRSEFGADGFNYLLGHGIDYSNAHHPHANTITCVGHATIATGSYPSLHGIIANDWFDRQTKTATYCVEDLTTFILPTARTTATLPGRSPRNLQASTISDEIDLAQIGRSFAVSLKDRAAVTLAGHAGKAFWFDKTNGGFVTSNYYYSSYPDWVEDWNRHYTAKNETWGLAKDISYYRFQKAPMFKNRFPGFGQSFPHYLDSANNRFYYKFLSMSPYADELTADFTTALIKNEKLGKSANRTDYLGISFSATDAIGHQFGPNSLESEDNILRLDHTLAKLLKTIDEQVGLQNTLIILTADHGVSDSPVYLTNHHFQQIPALNEKDIRTMAEKILTNYFHLPAQTLQAFDPPYLYLDHQLINEHQLSLQQVSSILAEALRQQPGIFQAYPIPLTGVEKNWLSAKVDRMAFPNRAGDIYIVPPPYQSLASRTDRVSHGTPWQYDSYVPMLFSNPLFKKRQISRPVFTTDIAPTLAALLKIKFPSAAVGQPLPEVMTFYEENS